MRKTIKSVFLACCLCAASSIVVAQTVGSHESVSKAVSKTLKEDEDALSECLDFSKSINFDSEAIALTKPKTVMELLDNIGYAFGRSLFLSKNIYEKDNLLWFFNAKSVSPEFPVGVKLRVPTFNDKNVKTWDGEVYGSVFTDKKIPIKVSMRCAGDIQRKQEINYTFFSRIYLGKNEKIKYGDIKNMFKKQSSFSALNSAKQPYDGEGIVKRAFYRIVIREYTDSGYSKNTKAKIFSENLITFFLKKENENEEEVDKLIVSHIEIKSGNKPSLSKEIIIPELFLDKKK